MIGRQMVDNASFSGSSELLQSWSRAIDDRPELNAAVGGSDPFTVGRAQFEILKATGIPLSGRTVLCDLGCGIGRASAFVADACGPEVSLIGLDIVPEFISFCRSTIRSPWDKGSLDFRLLKDSNEHYPGSSAPLDFGVERESKKDLLLDFSGRVDFLWAFSVFTHLDTLAAIDQLRFVRQLLGPQGLALLTFFVFDEDAEACIAEGTNAYDLNGGTWDGEAFFGNPSDRLAFVGFHDGFLLREFRNAGLVPREKTLGSWRDARRGGLSFQDFYLLAPA